MIPNHKFIVRSHTDLLYWPVSLLTGYVGDGYDQLQQEAAEVGKLLEKVTGKNPELQEQLKGISVRFFEICAHITVMATADRDHYFPFIELLAEAHDGGFPVEAPAFGSIHRVMPFEAEAFSLLLESLHDLIRDAAMVPVPAVDINGLSALTQSMRNFGDTCSHLRIVKFNVLLQRAAELENLIERRSRGVA